MGVGVFGGLEIMSNVKLDEDGDGEDNDNFFWGTAGAT